MSSFVVAVVVDGAGAVVVAVVDVDVVAICRRTGSPTAMHALIAAAVVVS